MTPRSVLFSPGDRPEMLRKAPSSGADAVAFDLEDAVAPARKADARRALADVLSDPAFDPDCEVYVRVNPLPAGENDLDAVLGSEGSSTVDALVCPKASSPSDVTNLADAASDRGHDLPVLALIETAAGVLDTAAIARAPPTDALVFGAEDLAADIGATRTDEGTEVLYAREHVVLAARAAGVGAIDTIHAAVDDHEGLREAAGFARQLGYDGKLAIHPAQVDPIHEAMTPDADDVEWARRVLAARERADEANAGVFEVDGEMIDAPLVHQAERIVERASDETTDH